MMGIVRSSTNNLFLIDEDPPSGFYEPADITPTVRVYDRNGIVGSNNIMLFPRRLTRTATELTILVEKNQVAYTLNRDKALKLSADFIDEVDKQNTELRDLIDLIGIPRYTGSISKEGQVVLPDSVSTDSVSGGASGVVVNAGVSLT